MGLATRNFSAERLATAGYILGVTEMKAPYLITKKEWETLKESLRPCNAQSNFTKNSSSEMTSKLEKVQFLNYGVGDNFRALLAKVKNYEVTLHSEEEREELIAGLATVTTHEMVVKKALQEGKLVPPEVLADYPDLQGI